MPHKPRLGPRDRDVVDWLAHGLGRVADYARGHKVSVTAIEREEAHNRQVVERRQRERERRRSRTWAEAHAKRRSR